MTKLATEKQIKFIIKLGGQPTEGMTIAEASDEIEYLQTGIRPERIDGDVMEPVSVDWESEKAIGYDVYAEHYMANKSRRLRLFIPKSMIKDGKAPLWMLKKKVAEAMRKEGLSDMDWGVNAI